MGNREEAVGWFEKTVDRPDIPRHYFNLIATNPDFDLLRDDPGNLRCPDEVCNLVWTPDILLAGLGARRTVCRPRVYVTGHLHNRLRFVLGVECRLHFLHLRLITHRLKQ